MSDPPSVAGPVPPRRLRVAVIGAGSWGTALALHMTRAGHDVTLWGHDADKVEAMKAARVNSAYLEGFELPAELAMTASSAEAFDGAELVISVVPSRYLRAVWEQIGPSMPSGADLVSATKGIEQGSGLRMTQVLAACVSQRASLSALSGPSFARELSAGHPTAVTLGCEDGQAAERVQGAFSFGPLRVYRNPDLIGVELGGALKNVIAIAAGMVDGLELGTNTRAALICRGLKEMADLAIRLGACTSTLMGLAGLGDLVLTCTGPLSRNRSVGVQLGRGQTLQQALAGRSMVAEGVVTVSSAQQLAEQHGVEMPITRQVYRILYEDKPVREAMNELLARALVDEWPA